MEVPRLGVVSELQPLDDATDTATLDPSCICDLQRRPWQRQILDPLSEARDQTHVLMDTSPLSHDGNSSKAILALPSQPLPLLPLPPHTRKPSF